MIEMYSKSFFFLFLGIHVVLVFLAMINNDALKNPLMYVCMLVVLYLLIDYRQWKLWGKEFV